MIRTIDGFSRILGEAMAWLMLPVVLIGAAVVVLRYGFGIGFLWMQELFVWLHGLAFMLAAGFVLGLNGHVRVDALYRKLSLRGRAIINIVGVLFLLFPTVGVLAVVSHPMISASWRMLEKSSNLGGLPFVYIMKSGVLAFCILVGLQGLSLLAKSWLVLRGDERFLASQAPETQDDLA